MKNNFKGNIKNSISKPNTESTSNIDTKDESQEVKENMITFKIGKKKDDKSEKKAFPLYSDKTVHNELDKVVEITGYSKNELINMMIQHCLDTIEYTD